jgi:hypothetical protein
MIDTIQFMVTEAINDLTWDEWIALEEGQGRGTKNIMARFMVDESGKPISQEEAVKILGKIKLKELAVISSRFWKSLREKAVNPTIGG